MVYLVFPCSLLFLYLSCPVARVTAVVRTAPEKFVACHAWLEVYRCDVFPLRELLRSVHQVIVRDDARRASHTRTCTEDDCLLYVVHPFIMHDTHASHQLAIGK